jgi:hypothetical protein
MSTEKKSTAKPLGVVGAASKAASGSTGAVAKPSRAPKRPPLSLLLKCELLMFVKESDKSIPDVDLAKLASIKVGRAVLPATIADYRKQIGIANVRRPNAAQLSAHIEMLKAQVRSLGQEPVEAPMAAPATQGADEQQKAA